MSMIARRALPAFRVRTAAPIAPQSRFLQRRNASGVNSGEASSEAQKEGSNVLAKGAKRDPELYILLTIMTGAFALVGWHFSRNPTSSSSENLIHRVEGSEPWKSGGDSPYQFHPHGDRSKGKKDAPSALNEVIVPNVTLPKHLHEKYNKWGKEGY
ncbi:hypothetical protein K431DRAFT_281709 [Polychaeton citri CBS 116435]|uniref:Uncharacterized protein n=1 Tax=Polychaeton citri CBS 116435 TaxID=1314669 RepID=A0A9P4UTI0_9PEZI|nr:hypothetical protein K431DRAFT_281709 [Polychaeton citri CBS 116435]